MNILIIATGGTIGSVFDGTSINVRTDQKCAVAEYYAAQHHDVRFDIRSPLNILSERFTSEDINALASTLYQEELASYDGVILTVGSDNLAYISAFVGLLHADTMIPICLVATDKILSDPTANGYDNFSCAVELIRQGRRGVFVPYRNGDSVMYIHSATDVRQADLSDDVYSFHGAYAVFENGVLLEKRPYISHRIPSVFSSENLPRIQDNVLLIHPYPMLDYTRFHTDGVRAVLHTLYHSATLDSGAAAHFLGSLAEAGVPVYLASFRSERKMYQTAVDAIKDGAIPLYDISPECAYMKLLLACAQDEMSIREFMDK